MLDPATTFRDVKKAGAGWSARCPAHDDHRSSLSIGIGDAGRILLKCNVGCELDDILAAAHLEHADLFPEMTTTKATIEATYPYRDEGGLHLYDVVRFTPKDFRQRRADGVWKMAGVRRVLYRLPELQGQTIAYIAEGEKDADRLRAIGLPGTTNAGGAGKWRPEYVEQLKAASIESVVVLPDHDEPGRKHADDVARTCDAAGLKVKVVELPDLPAKGDVSDWLDAGHTRDDLVALVKATARDVPTPSVKPTAAAAAGPVLVRLAEVQAEHVNFLWEKRIVRGKLGLIVGDPGLGKSTITLDVASRVSRGMSWPDGGTASQHDVILLSAEDGLADTIRPRLDAMGADVTRIHALTAVRLPNGDERCVSLATDLRAIDTAIDQTAAGLVIVDPLSAYLGKTDSYKDGEVRGVLMPLADLAQRRGVAIVGIMHLGKGEKRSALYRALGSIAFVAAARIVLAVAPHPDDDEKRVLAWVKGNIAGPAATLAYSLAEGRLSWDADPVVGVDVEALLSAPVDRQERREADAWLRTMLTDGPVLSKEVEAAAQQAGIARRTLFRSKARLRVEAERVGYGPAGKWYWRLATPTDESPKSATPVEVAPFDETPTNSHRVPLLAPVAPFEREPVAPFVSDHDRDRDAVWARADARFRAGWK
jgi:hypothetical protein